MPIAQPGGVENLLEVSTRQAVTRATWLEMVGKAIKYLSFLPNGEKLADSGVGNALWVPCWTVPPSTRREDGEEHGLGIALGVVGRYDRESMSHKRELEK